METAYDNPDVDFNELQKKTIGSSASCRRRERMMGKTIRSMAG
jgi:hypothetical protein